jgi:hypothetical protein
MVGRRLHAKQGRMAGDRSSWHLVVVPAAAWLVCELRSKVMANLEGQADKVELRKVEDALGPSATKNVASG